MEQCRNVEQMFQEELKRSATTTAESDAGECAQKEENDTCKLCERVMSDMRKSAVRWLYLEWYKKSVLGLTLPNITELTPTLHCILLDSQNQDRCGYCKTSINEIVDRTLKPMSSMSEMYFSKTQTPAQGENNVVGELKSKRDSGSFFVRAAQKLNFSRQSSVKESPKKEVVAKPVLTTNFSKLLTTNPSQAPPQLFKHGTLRRGDGHGKVKIMLRVVNKKNRAHNTITCEPKKKQVHLTDPISNTGSSHAVPKTYSFDHIFTNATPQRELCSNVLTDLLTTVVNGNDACLLTYGYPKLGKTKIMTGRDDSPDNIGIIPCAISWLYQLIEDRKHRTGARFSVRVSAVEVVGKSENLKDLLAEENYGSTSSNAKSPSLYLPNERASTIQLSDFTELRSPSVEKAAYYFDAALAARTTVYADTTCDNADDFVNEVEEKKNSHLIFTMHVYQYMIDKVGTGEIHGGRSRLHLIDLSGCSRKGRARDASQGSWLTLSSLSNVIASLANGAKHIPHRNSKLTTLLREAMGSISTRINIVANVSQGYKHFSETLSTLQVTTRIHRTRKKKSRYSSSSGGESSCDEKRKFRRRNKPVTPLLVTEACQSDTVGESEFTSTSAADESCDTVIYLGPNGGAISDRELTDFEHPPTTADSHNKRINKKPSDEETIFNRNNRLYRSSPHHSNKPTLNNSPIVVNLSKAARNACTPDSTLERRSNRKSIDDMMLHEKRRSKEATDESDEIYSRKCVSENSSPVKEARLSSGSRFNEMSHPSTRCNSTESIDSVATVENFERQLVTKIAERFAVEDEFIEVVDKDDESTVFYIDDDLEESVGAKLENNNSYYDSPFDKYEPTSLQEQHYASAVPKRLWEYDSADDTDERTDRELSRRIHYTHSSSSKENLRSPQCSSKNHLSEGVSSGYESMRCESLANIAEEKSKRSTTLEQRKSDSSSAIRNNRHSSRRYDHIRTLLKERAVLSEELHCTLNKLVVNDIPLSQVDDMLQDYQMQDAANILSHENRILEKKVQVCKSHLQLVSTYDLSSSKHKRSFMRSPFKTLSKKIRAKLKKSSNSSNQNAVIVAVE